MVSALDHVRAAIASAVLGGGDAPVTIGEVTLRAHQRDALRRVRASIESSGGALLADEPGLGKTYVALAVAAGCGGAIVAAPAALRAMWHDSAHRAGVEIVFVSLEALSRGDVKPHSGARLVIVDEAHHACNPAAARYRRLARLGEFRRMLLLSATPVRNRRAELAALLALFMGPRAFALDDVDLARCVVRRAGDPSLLPAIDGPHWHRLSTVSRLRGMIERLPPALPALDGAAASALVAMTLARCWASSLAALESALVRRMQRGAAMRAILDEGRVPTRAELLAWVVGDDAMQLAFPAFVTHASPDAVRLRAVLDAHLCAVSALRDHIHRRVDGDAKARAGFLLSLRRAHDGARIVAFTSHAATAAAVCHALRREAGIALLTSRGARTAGGARPRADVIDALGASADRPARDQVSLVVTTDLLSEGVNLQGASVIVHLDVPWTPAGLDQRVGRAVRMGSLHTCVHVHGIAAPRGAEQLLTLEQRLSWKRAAHSGAVSAPVAAEALRALVRGWESAELRDVQDAVHVDAGAEAPLIGHAGGALPGFIAVFDVGATAAVVCGTRRFGHWSVSDAARDLLAVARDVTAIELERDAAFESSARSALDRWLLRRSAHESLGAGSTPSRARRALLARIDALARRTPVHIRATHAGRVTRVRELIRDAVSAGAELTLDELMRAESANLESLLAQCESKLTSGPLCAHHAHGPPVIRALLLLQRIR